MAFYIACNGGGIAALGWSAFDRTSHNTLCTNLRAWARTGTGNCTVSFSSQAGGFPCLSIVFSSNNQDKMTVQNGFYQIAGGVQQPWTRHSYNHSSALIDTSPDMLINNFPRHNTDDATDLYIFLTAESVRFEAIANLLRTAHGTVPTHAIQFATALVTDNAAIRDFSNRCFGTHYDIYDSLSKRLCKTYYNDILAKPTSNGKNVAQMIVNFFDTYGHDV